jgi:hypothetical protein
MKMGGEMPGKFEAVLLFRDDLRMHYDGSNAGLAVDASSGIVIWWIYHHHADVN